MIHGLFLFKAKKFIVTQSLVWLAYISVITKFRDGISGKEFGYNAQKLVQFMAQEDPLESQQSGLSILSLLKSVD